MKILNAADTTGDSTPWSVGRGQFTAQGTWDGATASMEMTLDDGTTWIAVSSATTMTANGTTGFDLPSCTIRVAISSAGTTSLTAWADRRA